LAKKGIAFQPLPVSSQASLCDLSESPIKNGYFWNKKKELLLAIPEKC
jgi:hypothetical protein